MLGPGSRALLDVELARLMVSAITATTVGLCVDDDKEDECESGASSAVRRCG